MRRSRVRNALVAFTMVTLVVGFSLPHVSAKNKDRGNTFRGKAPKNIIIMVSDGWGFNQVLATNYYVKGKARAQVYERFPFKSAMSHYSNGGSYDPSKAWSDFDYVKSGATDSAAAATAMSTGYKTYSGAIGVDNNKNDVQHMMEYAESLKSRKSTGVVSSVEFSHATPAAFVAHNESRNNYAEIAQEMLYDSECEVILGCGNPFYDNDGQKVAWFNSDGTIGGSPLNTKYVGGDATWKDLNDSNGLLGADCDGDGYEDAWKLITTRKQFQDLATGRTPKRVVGVPHAYQTLQYNRSSDLDPNRSAEPYPYYTKQTGTVPTLCEMTKVALNVLDNNKNGFVLMVEGGAVDWAGHGNNSARLIEEQIDFNHSVDAVVAWVKKNSNWGETLVIVTGDHETGYLCGPGSDPDWEPLVNNGKGYLPGMEWHSGSHTNQLIPFFAKGAGAKWFKNCATGLDDVRGRYIDNTNIADVAFKALKAQR